MPLLRFSANRNRNISPDHCALNDNPMANLSDLTLDPLPPDRSRSTSRRRNDSLARPVQL
jgi:hypothetical protein